MKEKILKINKAQDAVIEKWRAEGCKGDFETLLKKVKLATISTIFNKEVK